MLIYFLIKVCAIYHNIPRDKDEMVEDGMEMIKIELEDPETDFLNKYGFNAFKLNTDNPVYYADNDKIAFISKIKELIDTQHNRGKDLVRKGLNDGALEEPISNREAVYDLLLGSRLLFGKMSNQSAFCDIEDGYYTNLCLEREEEIKRNPEEWFLIPFDLFA